MELFRQHQDLTHRSIKEDSDSDKNSRKSDNINLTNLECGTDCTKLTVHNKLEHANAKPFECDICHATFRTREKICFHMQILHPYLDQDPISISIKKEDPESDENISFNHGSFEGNVADEPILIAKLRKPHNQCKLCPRRYSNEDKHMLLHSIKSEFFCSICDTNFVTLSDQQSHERRSHNVKNIHCPDCPATFHSIYHLKRHRITHSSARTLTSKSVQPKQTSVQKPQYHCKLCQRRYKDEERHMVKFHSAKTEFVCATCTISFTSLSDQQTHERGVHKVKNMHCTECSASFYSNYHLKRHSLKHSSGGEIFECDICRASFKSRENIRLHMAIHINARRHKCAKCNKAFNYRTQLTQHMRVHSEICPYQCETCGKSFKSNGSLKLHRNTHTGDKPFKCELCEKAYTTLMNLQLHTRTHTGDKPYVCGTCGRPFHDASTLRTHRRLHSGHRPFVCHICGKATKQAGGLRSHYRKFHKVNDITNQTIRQNAKALAEKKRPGESTELQATEESVKVLQNVVT